MNKIITHLDLDLASSNEYKIINAQQLDNNTRRLEVNLFHEGKIYDISNVTRIELQGSRGDGLVIKTTLSHNGNTIIIDFDDTILGAKGLCKLKIALYNSGELLSSFPFIIRVDENVYDENGIIASPVYSELDETLKKVKDIETKESSRVEAENKRVSSEQARNNAESTRIKAEESRVSSENERRNSETSRVSEFTNMKNELSEIVENNKNINIEAIAPDDEHYQVKVTDKNGTSKTSANLLSKLSIGTVETGEYDEVPTANITGKFGEQKLNLRLPIGKPFKIKKTYSSITDMNQNIQADLDLYEFCMIDTGSVQDEDTAKLYMRDVDGAHYITDLSGAQGIQGVKGETGATPNLTVGTVTTGEPGTDVVVTVTGTDENPIFNFTIPKGEKGDSVIVDSELSSTSTNPVQNKVVKTELDKKANSSHTHTKSQITDFPTSLPASDVYSWAKNATKPTYTASEVGALPVYNAQHQGTLELKYSADNTETSIPPSGVNFAAYAYNGAIGANDFYEFGEKLEDKYAAIDKTPSYEKGEWTPYLLNNSINPSSTTGEYIKIGKLVYIGAKIVFSTSEATANFGAITGLPFAINTNNATQGYYGMYFKTANGTYGAMACFDNYMDASPCIMHTDILGQQTVKYIRLYGQYETN